MKNEEKIFLGSQAQGPLARDSGAPDATLCAIWALWDLHLNGLAVEGWWTRLGRVRSSRIQNLCLKGTPSSGWKCLVALRPCLGVKRSEKGRARLYFSLNIFADFLKGLPKC